MVQANNSEQEGKYDILQNAAGEILIIIKYHQGGPENPRFVYDGGSTALLYRSRESAIMLDNINDKAKIITNITVICWFTTEEKVVLIGG